MKMLFLLEFRIVSYPESSLISEEKRKLSEYLQLQIVIFLVCLEAQ